MIIGIDPGLSGGIAVIKDGEKPYAYKMPETEKDLYELLKDLMREMSVETPHAKAFAYLERVGARPGQSAVSGWTFAQHYGALRMALISTGIPFETVTPQIWQKEMKCLSKGDKNVTKRRAQELFPGVAVTHAIADALLIAEFGRRKKA